MEECVWRPRVEESWKECVLGMDMVDTERANISGWRVKTRPDLVRGVGLRISGRERACHSGSSKVCKGV